MIGVGGYGHRHLAQSQQQVDALLAEYCAMIGRSIGGGGFQSGGSFQAGKWEEEEEEEEVEEEEEEAGAGAGEANKRRRQKDVKRDLIGLVKPSNTSTLVRAIGQTVQPVHAGARHWSNRPTRPRWFHPGF
eukprot:729917-Prorocentrum_minimum.AAC.1